MKLASLAALITGAVATGAWAQTASTPTAPKIDIWPDKPELNPRLVRTPLPATDPATWLQPPDYLALAPSGPIIDHEFIELSVDPAGQALACKAVSFGPYAKGVGEGTDTTSQICPVVVKRSRLRPAIGTNGRKLTWSMKLKMVIYGRYADGSLPLEFVSPPLPPAPPAFKAPPKLLNPAELAVPQTGPLPALRAHIDIGSDGAVMACNIDTSSGNDAVDLAACKLVLTKARFDPGIGWDGKPVRTDYWLNLGGK